MTSSRNAGCLVHTILGDGEIWMRSEGAGHEWHWTVLDPNGEPLGEVVLPGSVDLRTIHAETLWAVETHEFGVPWVVRYRVRRQG